MAQVTNLPALVNDAARRLLSAKSCAEILDAKAVAGIAYTTAKATGRAAKAKDAHDKIIDVVHHTQASALKIEALANRRLADEYDAAQERGEVHSAHSGAKRIPDENSIATTEEIGISSKDIYDARLVRDAEEVDPGVIDRSIDEMVEAGEEPTKARLRGIIIDAAAGKLKIGKKHSGTKHKVDWNNEIGICLEVFGACNIINRVAENWTADQVLLGCTIPSIRETNIEIFTEALNFLSLIIEKAKAE